MGKRDAQHCMPVKQIPDLGWKTPEEPTVKNKPLQQSRPVLRSSKSQAAVTEIKEETHNTKTEDRGKITSKFLTIAATTTVMMLYTAACKLIETNLF